MPHQFFVSAYATSPSGHSWSPDIEHNYFKSLSCHPSIIGIEHPFLTHSDKYPLDWLIANIPNHWKLTITLLPEFMSAAKKQPSLGLASTCEKGRTAALHIMEKLHHYICTLNQLANRTLVHAVHFHTFPYNTDHLILGSQTALDRSLRTITEMDWGKTALNLEHCDSFIPNQTAEKGFLPLNDEIDVLKEFNHQYGLVLNWGRSAIEGRSNTTPIAHLKMANDAKLLKGYFFSGCTDQETSAYGAWKDTHMPPTAIIDSRYLDQDSLLGHHEIQQTIEQLHPSTYLGVKVFNPSQEKKLEAAIHLNTDTIDAINTLTGA